MTPANFSLYLACLFLGSAAQMSNLKSSNYVKQETGFRQDIVGGKVTLRCFYEGEAVMFYWYKQPLGQKPRIVSSFFKHQINGSFHDEFENDSRFSLDTGNGKNHLTISDLRISDSATYYCMGCYAYDYEFTEGVVVSVKGSGLNIPAFVRESVSGTIQPGDSVPLKCTIHSGTCYKEHSVYYFKDSEESHPGLIYTHGGGNEQCERKPETHTCVYNLPMKNLDVSKAEMSHCAVASCGHILFGKQKQTESESADGHSLELVYFLSGALAITTTLVFLLAYTTYRMYKTNSCEHVPGSPTASTPNAESYQDSANLHYAALKTHKAKRSTKQGENTHTECVYSTVRQ
ncbi:hypothetical protein Q5P01_002253 [Channa striata]|uniref:Ig-like domain-containing protein n=1 Tax=Channa striata TaxID=64152 RepID=A0AA88NNV1_CHASR|nr:hypothetical protein Q5P01_002253 [Channa striata]